MVSLGHNESIIYMLNLFEESKMYLHFNNFDTVILQVIDILSHGKKINPFSLHSQYHDYWWPGDIRSQCISRPGTDLFLRNRIACMLKNQITWVWINNYIPESSMGYIWFPMSKISDFCMRWHIHVRQERWRKARNALISKGIKIIPVNVTNLATYNQIQTTEIVLIYINGYLKKIPSPLNKTWCPQSQYPDT